MADSLPALGSAIYARLGTVQYSYATTGTAVYSGTLGLYNSLAPQQSAPPYVVFQLQSAVDGYAWGSHEEESNDFVVKVVSLKNYPSQEAYPIYAAAHTAMQDAPLSVSGYRVMRVRRTNRIQYRDQAGYWHVGGTYTIDLVDS